MRSLRTVKAPKVVREGNSNPLPLGMGSRQRKTQDGSATGFKPVWMPDFLFDFQAALVEWAIEKGRAAHRQALKNIAEVLRIDRTGDQQNLAMEEIPA